VQKKNEIRIFKPKGTAMMVKKHIILFFLFLAAAPLFGQKFTATVSKNRVAAGENFVLEFTLNGEGTSFKAPPLSDFIVYQGPNRSHSMSIYNGVTSQTYSISYILAPRKEGKFTIGPASIIVNGSKIESNTVTIEVKGTYSPHSQNPRQYHNPQQPTPPGENVSDNLFVRTIVSKKKAYLGEQITVSHKVYTRLNLKGFRDVKFPSYNGFWAQDVTQQQHLALNTETLDGVVYNVAELKRSYLFAQRTGQLELPSLEAECVVRERVRSSDSWSDPFGIFDTYRDQVYNIKSKPVIIEVMSLPEKDKPSGFTGAVGDYTFKASLDKEKVKANEAINLNLTISGRGNLKLIEPLKLEFPESMETYTPKVNDNITLSGGGVSGSKSFDYLVIPREEGTYTIGGASFSYFDPEKKTYVVLPSPEFSITVEKGDEGSAAVMNKVRPKEDVKMLNSDIRYIKTGSVLLTDKQKHFFGSPMFYAGLGIPSLALFLFLFFRKKHIERNSDIVQVKSRQATRMARRRLAEAEKHIKAGNKERFYEEIFRALYGYLSDKLNIPVADLSKDSVAAGLAARGVNADTNGRMIATLDTCEFARYASSAAPGDLQKIYSDSVSLITQLEEEIK
jgi:hypothetical protein